MSKNQTSQAQQDTPRNTSSTRLPFEGPFSTVVELWTRMTRDGVGRVQAFGDEWIAIESAAYDRARGAAEEVSRLVADSIDYSARLAAEWRKLGIDAARRSAELMDSKG
jgi:hypothetical protein